MKNLATILVALYIIPVCLAQTNQQKIQVTKTFLRLLETRENLVSNKTPTESEIKNKVSTYSTLWHSGDVGQRCKTSDFNNLLSREHDYPTRYDFSVANTQITSPAKEKIDFECDVTFSQMMNNEVQRKTMHAYATFIQTKDGLKLICLTEMAPTNFDPSL